MNDDRKRRRYSIRIRPHDVAGTAQVAPLVLAPNLADSKLLADTLLPVRGTTVLFASNAQFCQFVQTFGMLKRMSQNLPCCRYGKRSAVQFPANGGSRQGSRSGVGGNYCVFKLYW